MKFPFSLFKVPTITVLSLEQHEIASVYPLRLNGALPLPSVPVHSLVELNFSFIQSFSVLRVENGIPLLETYFPNLKRLKLTNSSVTLMDTHVEAFPKGLEELHLASVSMVAPVSTAPANALVNLPATLNSLFIDSGHILTDADTKDYSTIVWPSHISILSLRCVDPCMLHHLPPDLVSLHLAIKYKGGKTVSSPVPTSAFPRTLTYLSVLFNGPAPFMSPTTFPPSLTYCYLPFGSLSSSADVDWSHLPKSLTYCSLTPGFTPSMPNCDRLPNLTRLFGIPRLDPMPASLLNSLPKNLRVLSLFDVKLSEIPYLPPTLQDLRIKISPLSSRAELPSADASSSKIDVLRGDVSRLPPSLTSLGLQNADPGKTFCKADFELLPSTIQKMTIFLDAIQDIETLLALPRALKQLSLHILSQTNQKLVSDRLLFDALPSGLNCIDITTYHSEAVWEQWMCQLHRFTALEEISVVLGIGTEYPPVSLEFIPSLPDTITKLSLPLIQTKITPEIMAGLPRKLASLHLTCMSTRAQLAPLNSATDECFENLPRSLVSLKLPRSLLGLTKRLLSILPTSIVQITLPGSFMDNATLDLFWEREEDWNGFKPGLPAGFGY